MAPPVNTEQATANGVTFWATVVVALACSVRTMNGIVTASDIHTIKDDVVSQPHKGNSLSTWDKSAYIRMDRDFYMEVALPALCGGVFFLANFTMVYFAVAVAALLVGAANYAVSESAVTLSGVDTIRINAAISKWAGAGVGTGAGDKPDLRVMSGFLKQWCVGSRGPVLTYARAVFSIYQGSFAFLARVMVTNAILCASIWMVLMGASRLMTSKARIFGSRRRPSQNLYIRRIDGRSYVRRSVLIYMVTGLPSLSVLTTILLQWFHKGSRGDDLPDNVSTEPSTSGVSTEPSTSGVSTEPSKKAPSQVV